MTAEVGRRSVSLGGAFYVVGAVQFFASIYITGLRYGPPDYSPLRDTISDLQAVNCGLFQGGQVCSPLHVLANSSVAVLGLLLVTGTVLFRQSLPTGQRRTVAISLMIVAGVSTFANAFTPEDVTYLGDLATALIAFLCANFALIQIGRVMSEAPDWRGFHLFSEILGIVGLAALMLDGADIIGPLGSGGIEWLIVAPTLVWMLVVGVHLLVPSVSSRF